MVGKDQQLPEFDAPDLNDLDVSGLPVPDLGDAEVDHAARRSEPVGPLPDDHRWAKPPARKSQVTVIPPSVLAVPMGPPSGQSTAPVSATQPPADDRPGLRGVDAATPSVDAAIVASSRPVARWRVGNPTLAWMLATLAILGSSWLGIDRLRERDRENDDPVADGPATALPGVAGEVAEPGASDVTTTASIQQPPVEIRPRRTDSEPVGPAPVIEPPRPALSLKKGERPIIVGRVLAVGDAYSDLFEVHFDSSIDFLRGEKVKLYRENRLVGVCPVVATKGNILVADSPLRGARVGDVVHSMSAAEITEDAAKRRIRKPVSQSAGDGNTVTDSDMQTRERVEFLRGLADVTIKVLALIWGSTSNRDTGTLRRELLMGFDSKGVLRIASDREFADESRRLAWAFVQRRTSTPVLNSERDLIARYSRGELGREGPADLR